MNGRTLRCDACSATVETVGDLCPCGAPFIPVAAEQRAARVNAEHPDWSLRQIAKAANVGTMTVQRVRAKLAVPDGTPAKPKPPSIKAIRETIRRLIEREPDPGQRLALIEAARAELDTFAFEAHADVVGKPKLLVN